MNDEIDEGEGTEPEEEETKEETPKVVTKKKPAAKAKVIFKKPEKVTDVAPEEVPSNTKEEKPAKRSKSQSIQDKMAAERRKKVDEAKKDIEKTDKVRLAEAEAEAEVNRKRVKAESAERKAKDDKVEKVKTQTKAQARTERRAASAERLAARGRAKCPGSNLDVEKEKLEVTTGVKLRENPWSKKGKRVRCPKCKRSVGIHTVGRKSQQKTPTSYNLNTHYVKVKDGKPQPVKAKVAKAKKVVTKAVKKAVVGKGKVVKKKTRAAKK